MLVLIMQQFVISGGPGSGKSTLLEALQQAGYACSEEVSRQLIQEEVAKESTCLPWINLSCFAEKALERMTYNYQYAEKEQITFFDRGIPDIIAYLKTAGIEPAQHFYEAAQTYRYAPIVFITPPWDAIYVNDSERWQSFEEAVTLYQSIKAAYLAVGYQIIDVPRVSVKERVQFVTDLLLSLTSRMSRQKNI